MVIKITRLRRTNRVEGDHSAVEPLAAKLSITLTKLNLAQTTHTKKWLEWSLVEQEDRVQSLLFLPVTCSSLLGREKLVN